MVRIVRALWGDMTVEELKKFGILSVAMMLVIGNYWMLRVTKDALFDMLVGYRQWQPVAKMFSIVAMVFIVLGYSKLVDILSRQRLIYLMCSLYGGAFIILSYFIANPEIATLSETSILYPYVAWIPGKAIGWFSYVLLESYGSLLIAIFYAFVASVITTGSAKKGWGMLASIIQFGTISGILVSMFFVPKAGLQIVYFIGGFVVLLAPFVIKFYLKVFPKDIESVQQVGGKKKTGFFEGLRLIVTMPYVMGIFVVATFYEIISTIVEYQMGWIATGIYTPEQFTVFKSFQGLGINFVALFFALVGTSFFMRKFGLRFCLMAFPATIAAVVLIGMASKMVGGIGDYPLMWILLGSTVAIKGLNYALNKPTSEVMYIPTSKDVKFKAKGWIDMFGNRSTKGMGSAVSKSLGHSFSALILYGTIISLGIVGVWILIARFVGNKFNELQEKNTMIE